MFSITQNNLIIRTMKVEDVSAYIARFNYPKKLQKEMILKTKDVIKRHKDDEPDLYFTIVHNGRIIGGIAARGFADSPCDAMVQIDLPNSENNNLEETIKEMFIKLASKEYFYDTVYFVEKNELGYTKLSKRFCLTSKVSNAI